MLANNTGSFGWLMLTVTHARLIPKTMAYVGGRQNQHCNQPLAHTFDTCNTG